MLTARRSAAGRHAVIRWRSSGLREVECGDDANSDCFAFISQHEAAELREVLECFDADALRGFEANEARL